MNKTKKGAKPKKDDETKTVEALTDINTQLAQERDQALDALEKMRSKYDNLSAEEYLRHHPKYRSIFFCPNCNPYKEPIRLDATVPYKPKKALNDWTDEQIRKHLEARFIGADGAGLTRGELKSQLWLCEKEYGELRKVKPGDE